MSTERSRSNEAIMHQLFLDSPVGILLLRADGVGLELREINDAARTALGMTPDVMVGGDLLDLIRPVVPLTRFDAWVRSDAGPVWHGMAAAKLRRESWLDVHLSAIDTEDGLIYSAQIIDLSEQHLAPSRMESAQLLTGATVDTARCIILVVDGHRAGATSQRGNP